MVTSTILSKVPLYSLDAFDLFEVNEIMSKMITTWLSHYYTINFIQMLYTKNIHLPILIMKLLIWSKHFRIVLLHHGIVSNEVGWACVSIGFNNVLSIPDHLFATQDFCRLKFGLASIAGSGLSLTDLDLEIAP